MKLLARCKHCGESRTWEKLPDGSVVSTEIDGPLGRLRYPYTCAVSADQQCAPLVQTAGERMVADIARQAGKRAAAIGNGVRKRR